MYQSGGPPSFTLLSSYGEGPVAVLFAPAVSKGVNVAGDRGWALLEEVPDDDPVGRTSERWVCLLYRLVADMVK